MVIGIRTLNFSAEVAMHDEEEKNGVDKQNKKKAGKRIQREPASCIDVAFSLAVGVAVFFVTPLAITTFLFDVDQQPLWFNIIAGAIRIGLLLAYLAAISMVKDIQAAVPVPRCRAQSGVCV